jgi:hypothetical protein
MSNNKKANKPGGRNVVRAAKAYNAAVKARRKVKAVKLQKEAERA